MRNDDIIRFDMASCDLRSDEKLPVVVGLDIATHKDRSMTHL